MSKIDSVSWEGEEVPVSQLGYGPGHDIQDVAYRRPAKVNTDTNQPPLLRVVDNDKSPPK